MQQFLVEAKNKTELQKTWAQYALSGNCFLVTARPFALNEEFRLVFRIAAKEAKIIIPARVIQILQGVGPQGKGMIAELLRLEQYKVQVCDLIQDLEKTPWTGDKDFSQVIAKRVTPAERLEKFLQHLRDAAQNIETKNYYDILGVPIQASQDEIHKSHQNMIAGFASPAMALSLEAKDLLDLLRAKIKEAYAVLSDKPKRWSYDFKLGKVVKARDESLEDFKKKKMDFAKHLVRMKNRANVDKGEKVFELAQEALHREDYAEARNQLRICIAFDPFNEDYKTKIKEIEKLVEKKAVPDVQKKMDKILSQQREVLKGEEARLGR